MYAETTYSQRHARTQYTADTVLAFLFPMLPSIRSCFDLGCGVGTWLAAARRHGVQKILGIDGEWVNPELLQIHKDCFIAHNMAWVFPVIDKFDLGICLEVAEHLPAERADSLVDFLTTHCNYCLFSAAIPEQGGTGHVNEQWPEYWTEKFTSRGFIALDILRNHIWNDAKIPFWYRQNIFLCVRSDLAVHMPSNIHAPVSLVHPELYAAKKIGSVDSVGQNNIQNNLFKLFLKPVLFRVVLFVLLFGKREYILQYVRNPRHFIKALFHKIRPVPPFLKHR